jgi:His/Glu/Gln/Arg/opine family amino acid ABC transporter permease subunit
MHTDYVFQFRPVWAALPRLVDGALLTLELSVAVIGIGLAIGIACALARSSRRRWLRWPVAVYVEAIRNTPFLVQLFFIFFGLPAVGVKLDDWQAASLTMVINLGAYCTEIIRAGVQATPRGQIEAASALAMTRSQIFLHVVLRPALARVWPAIASQVVIVMLGSSVCSQIGAEELTFAANFIQSRNFRAFETYFVVAALYLAMAIVLRRVLLLGGQRFIVGRPLMV